MTNEKQHRWGNPDKAVHEEDWYLAHGDVFVRTDSPGNDHLVFFGPVNRMARKRMASAAPDLVRALLGLLDHGHLALCGNSAPEMREHRQPIP